MKPRRSRSVAQKPGKHGRAGTRPFTARRRARVGLQPQAENLESLLMLPKHHSQSAQDLVKKSTSNPGTGGSNEKAISRKRSARRVELGNVGGIRCRKEAAGIYTAAAA